MTMPYWVERLRVRMIHELGGYTAEDVAKEIYEATRAMLPCKEETFRIEDYVGYQQLGDLPFVPTDPRQLDRVKEAVITDIALRLKINKVVQYSIVQWWDGTYALKATLRVAVPDK